MAISVIKYAGDFETTTTPEDLRVWASCLVDIETSETAFIGNDIESFFDFLRKRNSMVYFHNLKFDGEFILSYLLRNGYRHDIMKTHQPGTFETLITDDGMFYSITVYFEKKNKKYKKVVFQDSLKKLPFKVAAISKAFELENKKLIIDYDAPRPVGWEQTLDERQYVVNDCRIVAQALKIQFDKGLTKMTNASDAMNGYKEIISKPMFEKWFPVMPIEIDALIRKSYRGGWTFLNPIYKGQRVVNGRVYDVNSLYPSRMKYCTLPFGYPMYYEGEYESDERYPLYIQHMEFCFKLKQGHLPCIQLKNSGRFISTEYLTTSADSMGIDRPVEMWLTKVDLELIRDHYDISDEKYLEGFKFKGAEGMFNAYIDYWMHIKETSTGALRQLAKLMLNSLYGRFALNPKGYKKQPRMDPDGVVRYDVLDEEFCSEHKLPPPEMREPVYTAMACFITAYAREYTIRTAQKNYDRFIYADTDSLHLEGDFDPLDVEIHNTKLGAWKHEGTFCDSIYIRAKTYMETMVEQTKNDALKSYARILNKTFDAWREDGFIRYHDTRVTCAGMPDNIKYIDLYNPYDMRVDYETFRPGASFEGKLMPRRYPGGVVLQSTTFTIK